MSARTCRRASCDRAIPVRDRDSKAQAAARQFCSRACYDAHNDENTARKTCAVCGQTFTPGRGESRRGFEQRVNCSRVCSGAAKRARHGGVRPSKACAAPRCGKTFEAKPYESAARWDARRYCSRACAAAFREASRPPAPKRTPAPRRRRKPRPELSVFGDPKPAQPWRPPGFSPAPAIRTEPRRNP